ncbi:MAG TPA: hypothetical protein DCQ36_13095 [Actinobacteria bacterium]|jgi:hypothetical protein|nr:hypothetical protein [Actinomycetota bacterium]
MTARAGRRGRLWAGIVLLIAGGFVLGIVGAFVQAHRAVIEGPWGVLVVPWGVPLVWLALVMAIRGGVWLLRTRGGGWSVTLGWIGATVLMSAETSSGDLALSGGGRQLTYLLGGVILASAAASLPLPRRNLPVS